MKQQRTQQPVHANSKYTKSAAALPLKLVLFRVVVSVCAVLASLGIIYKEQLLFNETLRVELSADLQQRVAEFLKGKSPSNMGLVLLAHDREEYLAECLDSLMAARGFNETNLIVSMDDPGHYESIRKVFADRGLEARTLFVENEMFLGTWFFHTMDDCITNHYRRALELVFDRLGFEFGVFLETDLVVSKDFLEFMNQGAEYLATQPVENVDSVFCVSGWNDNGFEEYELGAGKLFRTDFFPGLGWMIQKHTWTDILSPAWPSRFGNNVYDMWIRYRSPLAYRECLAPEVSRTHHISKYGTHVNGRSHHTFDSMVLSDGEVVVGSEEFELAGNVTRFEQRVREEYLLGAERISLEQILKKIPEDSRLIVVVEGGPHDSVALELEKILARLGLFTRTMRSAHKGLLSVHLVQFNTRVTIVRDDFASHWDL